MGVSWCATRLENQMTRQNAEIGMQLDVLTITAEKTSRCSEVTVCRAVTKPGMLLRMSLRRSTEGI